MAKPSSSLSEDLEKSSQNELIQPTKRLFTFLFPKRIPPIPADDERKPYPVHDVSLLNRMFFVWITPLLYTGYRRKLDDNDLFYMSGKDSVVYQSEKLQNVLDRRVKSAKTKFWKSKYGNDPTDDELETLKVGQDGFEYPKYILIMSLFEAFKAQCIFCFILRLLSDLFTCFSPLLTKELISFVERSALGLPVSIGRGIGFAVGASLFVFFRGFCMAHYFNSGGEVGVLMRSALSKIMYDKTFQLSDEVQNTTHSNGNVFSILTQDLSRVEMAMVYTFNITVFPFIFAITIILLCINIGATALIGILVFVSGMIFIFLTTKKLKRLRVIASQYTDLRVSAIKEVLNNFKMIKLYSWEDSYLAKIKSYRFNEMNQLLKIHSIRSLIMSLSLGLPVISSLITFVCMYNISGMRNVANVFTGLAFFSVLTTQALMMPLSLSASVDAMIALKRVKDMLLLDDFNEDIINHGKAGMNGLAICVENGEFTWNKTTTDASSESSESSEPISEKSEENELKEIALVNKTFTGLHNINLSIKLGEFVIVTGLIGSGKTSLLEALTGVMHRTSGKIDIDGSLIFCGVPWIQNTTVRNNIVFGLPFDQDKYDAIVEACCLQNDFNQLPDGEFTLVGERGITLSGGQKARINLARAVYSDKDIVLLDDVLSAVDAKVGQKIMNHCITKYLGTKTRVLATHQLSLIKAADRVIFVNIDGTLSVGTFDELIENCTGFRNLYEYANTTSDEKKLSKVVTRGVDGKPEKDDTAPGKPKEFGSSNNEVTTNNSIKIGTYVKYLRLAPGIFGSCFFPLLVSVSFLATFDNIFVGVWLSYWTNNSFKNLTASEYQGIYTVLTFMTVILVAFLFWLVSYMLCNSAKFLHVMSLDKVFNAPMSFIDTTPMGRILNRFTTDTDVTDNELTDQVRLLIQASTQMIGIFILCICYFPWFAIAVPVLLFAYVCFSNFYAASSRDINRMKASKASVVFSNFNETLTGMASIKAYGSDSEERFKDKNAKLLDNWMEVAVLTVANQRWLAVYLSFLSALFLFIVSMLCVYTVFNINASDTGVILTNVLQVANMLSFVVRSYTLVESKMTSVERLVDYAYDLPQEPQGGEILPDNANWPSEGKIEYDHVSMRYRDELPLVLNDCTLSINGKSRLGICGRTGAGKSTILSTLYRLNELASGKIMIDGVDISTLNLKYLRAKLSIIPQDPVLFHGSIRDNLDPFHESEDTDLWNALRRSGLIEAEVLQEIENQSTETDKKLHKFHLDQHVEDDGGNFSLGERQLLALARALVRKSKILILDEATSSVDYETDFKIQQTIEHEFNDCTILCIAHRLKTIIDYDNILVLEKGSVEEFGPPVDLYKQNGIFKEMCEKSGITCDDFNY